MEEIIIGLINHWVFKAVFTTIFTAIVAWAIAINKKIKNSASKNDVEKGVKEGKDYTDKTMRNHESMHKNIEENFAEIRDDNKRIENKIDQLLMVMVGKK